VWLDARGLQVGELHARVVRELAAAGATRVRAGASVQPVVARLAALGAAESLVQVAAGGERAFLAAQTLAALGVEERVCALLEGVGIETCGALGALPREAVEVRFGAEAVAWWRLARAEDERRLFLPVPPPAPHASLDFIDYVVTDPERLLFTANALLGTVCDRLGNGSTWERELRPARPTASRATWLRLVRVLLERLTVADAVAGVALSVLASEAAGAVQGDLFDSGFATASAVEAAVARLLEEQGAVVVRPSVTAHPLIEERVRMEPLTLREATSAPAPAGRVRERRVHAAAGGTDAAPAAPDGTALTLQLLQQPKPILVETVQRRDHEIPVRYRDAQWHALVSAAGPDRVSGGQWDRSYAREYFRAVTAEGTLVWLFRDACRDRWYLHGWWD
jgi:nucleotidyltransferase/DNA polymerase involved in DNA repair